MIKYIQKSLDFASWNVFEKVLVSFITTIIMGSTFYFSYITPYETFFDVILNWIISPVAAITGIVCVVLVAKENITNYYWGIVNAIMYGAISWYSGYYGDWILNWFFFLPFQFIGWVVWKKYHMDKFSKVYIKPRKLTKQGIRIITIISIISLIGSTHVIVVLSFNTTKIHIPIVITFVRIQNIHCCEYANVINICPIICNTSVDESRIGPSNVIPVIAVIFVYIDSFLFIT